MGASGLLARGPPPSPAWVTYIKYAILGLSLICLAMGAWATSIYGGSYLFLYTSSGGMVIFVAIWNFIVYGGGLALEKFQPNNFFRIGLLIGYIFSVIFWLSAWAWSASLASLWLSIYSSANGFRNDDYYSPVKQLGAALAVCAALGAVVWVLCIVNLVMFIKACVSDSNSNNAELGNIKHEPAAYPAAQYPAQPYAAQPQAYPQQPQAYPQQPAAPYGQPQPYATQ
ncbi:hypothetical protein QBC34DRAFT_170940 [Podospora aff. communis PSN243]|uniref:MARVEL domain-containing protein n=1 Tax=Podospora aff. communis PSN243 TaxID=3040156 RepID=A0AAV9GC67_9PEZI|nr:hypothetical protein QBC34DRAFT_170940 [Podospora aff. communis PSN243]